ncbi:MAG: ABC transporter ATP-binding protein/permease, partial [Deltaproteobacteria bacterium]|nr:ABC transporter ATP-binding protein/permease [Deltaproteobacteria bacterium]
MKRLKFIFRYIYQYKFSYLFGILLIVLTNWISVTIPKYLQLCIDLLSQGTVHLEDNHEQLYDYLIVMFLLAIGIIFIRTLSRIFFFNPGRAIEYQVKNDLFEKLTKLQKDYYDNNPIGSIISRIQNDITGVRLICGFGMMQFFNILTALSFTPYMMWVLSPTLTLYCVIPIVLIFLVVRISMHYIMIFSRKRMTKLQDLSSFIVTSLSGIDIIKNYSLSPWSQSVFQKQNSELLDYSLKISLLRSFIMPILQNLENLLKVLVLLVGGIYVIENDFTIGELTAFIAYAGLLTMPITSLGWLTTIIQQGIIGLESIETILSKETREAEVPVMSEHERLKITDKELRIENLNYAYSPEGERVLNNISFTIKPFQTVGILGKIGSGKTTLVNCINRYLKTSPGHIFWGDQDITQMSFTDLRNSIRTVTQDNFLFSDSIRNNICFGLRDTQMPDDECLRKAIFDSALEDEVNRFEYKTETIVGEKGIMLSGGQKQRISLARALVEPCEILI